MVVGVSISPCVSFSFSFVSSFSFNFVVGIQSYSPIRTYSEGSMREG
jgi:hypothetical protein